MKTITVQELPGPVSRWLQSVSSEEEIAITDQDQVVARLMPTPKPPPPGLPDGRIDWTTSAAFTRDRTGERVLTAEETQAILDESQGNW